MHGAGNEKRRQNDVGPGEELRKDGAEEQYLDDGGHVVAVEVEEVHPEDVDGRKAEGADEEHVREELPIALQQKRRVEGHHEEDEGEGDGPVEDEERVEEQEKVDQQKWIGVNGEKVAGVGDGDEEHHSGDEN
ncbi:PREDICTED: protein ENDO16-like [Rhagoletis zephyria]|uniref:protein ENDO16-like n=1 Tax=Rhagoletis zephyria TaxID=28612 RepID=UPI0008115566|nr:PREDICTED: protein ENDO16-like [Rhagoletis zephyria]